MSEPEKLWNEIDNIRKQGFAKSFHEKFVGGFSVATPILGAMGEIVAALYISLPEQRYGEELYESCLHHLFDCASSISHNLGYR